MPIATSARLGRATALLLLGAAPACSFFVDFPDETTSRTGTGGGGGGTGGTPPTACFGKATGPTSDEITWTGIPATVNYDERVTATGLTYVADQQELYIFGSASDGLQTFDIPEGDANQVYVIGRFDTGVVELLLAGHSCTFPWSNRDPTTRRITTEYDGKIFAAGSLPTDEFASGVYSFSGETDGCGAADQLQYSTIAGDKAGPVPILYGANNKVAETINFTDGTTIDVATTYDLQAWLAAARGQVAGGTVDHTTPFLRMEKGADVKDIAMPGLYVDTKEPTRSWPGAIAIDDSNQVWFGGSSCAAPDGCDDPQHWLATMKFDDAAPEILEQRDGGKSAITAMRSASQRIVAGGNYQGGVPVRGIMLPDTAETAPFVVAMDPTTKTALWTWPAAGSAPANEHAYRSVVDLAVAGTSECGAVYVLGCSSPLSVGYVDCFTIEPGKTSFLVKLDLATGKEIWSNEVKLATTADTLMPGALAVTDDRLWVAGTFRGKIDAWGQHIETGGTRQAVVLRLEP